MVQRRERLGLIRRIRKALIEADPEKTDRRLMGRDAKGELSRRGNSKSKGQEVESMECAQEHPIF